MINADQLRALRLDRGLSQRKLAASAGVDALTIKRIEAGTDPGDLTLRVLAKIAEALGFQPSTLLRGFEAAADADARTRIETIGAALAAGGRSTRTGLARTADLPAPEVDIALQHLASRLAPLGIAIVRHGEEMWLAPQTAAAASGECHRPLDANQARLLRRIHRGEDVRRSLSYAQRTLTLPSLLRLGLVVHTPAGISVTREATRSLSSEPSTEATATNEGGQLRRGANQATGRRRSATWSNG